MKVNGRIINEGSLTDNRAIRVLQNFMSTSKSHGVAVSFFLSFFGPINCMSHFSAKWNFNRQENYRLERELRFVHVSLCSKRRSPGVNLIYL